MNLKSTIFILGAGASWPYGYPTASGLRENIIHQYQDVIEEMGSLMNLKKQSISDTVELLKTIVSKFDLSNTNSIDLFLTRNSETVDIKLGKQLIWLFIMWFERRSKLSSQIKESDEDWYYEFFNELTGDITSKNDLNSLPEEKIVFITFNYDRSLENYLFLSLKNSFSLATEETKKIMNEHFIFHHVYGKVLNLEWESENLAAPYKSNVSLQYLKDAPQLINLIYNERSIEVQVQSLIKSASTLVFLGFGFGKANIDFLNLRELLSPSHRILASGLGLYDSRIIKIKSFLQRGMVGIRDHNIQIEPKFNSLQLLRRYIF